MSKEISLKKNFFYRAAYDILIIILPFITAPYLGRVLGAEKLGEFSFYYAIAHYFVLFSRLGIGNYGNRTIAACRDDQEKLNAAFSSIMYAHLIFSILSMIAYFVFAVLFFKDDVCVQIMSLIVFSALVDISWFYFGIERFQYTVTTNFVVKILTVAAILLFVKSVDDLPIYSLIMSAGILLSQIILWFPLKRFVSFRKTPVRDVLLHIKPMLVLFIPVLAVSLYKVLNRIMLSDMSNMQELGFYDNAEKLVILPMTFISSFSSVMLPRMSNLIAKKDEVQTAKYMEISFFIVMWLGYGCTFGLIGISDVFAPVFWGQEFEPAAILIAGLALTIPFLAFAEVIRRNYIIPAKKDREFITSVVAGAVVNPILNYLLIPSFDAVGAVLSTIITEIVVCFIQVYAVRKNIAVGKYFKQTVLFIPFATLMMFGVYEIGLLMGKGVTTLLIQVLVGSIFYLLITWGILHFKKKDYPFIQFKKFKL